MNLDPAQIDRNYLEAERRIAEALDGNYYTYKKPRIIEPLGVDEPVAVSA